jgi:hypothetical protein
MGNPSVNYLPGCRISIGVIPGASAYAWLELVMRGVPMGVIAEQLGHADTRMTEKHYAHLAPSYIADTIRAHFPTLGIAVDATVTAMKRKAARSR